MATKLENIGLETAHFENFKNYIPKYDTMCKDTVRTLLDIGLIQVSTAFEHAIANCGSMQVISENAADLSDGSDAKLSSVRTSSYGTSYSAPITGIKNKTGTLRAQVYERKNDKFYYFKIPYDAYKCVPHTSNIEIPFNLDGTPRDKNNCRVNWWKFKRDSFEEMSK